MTPAEREAWRAMARGLIAEGKKLMPEMEWKDTYGTIPGGIGPGHIATVGVYTGRMVPANDLAYKLAALCEEFMAAMTKERKRCPRQKKKHQ